MNSTDLLCVDTVRVTLWREEKVWTIHEKKKITWTVFLILCEGPGYSGEYRSVRKRELISVDFPSPDSPERQRQSQSEWVGEMHFTLFLFSNPLFHARLERNMTKSPDVYQLHIKCSLSLFDILYVVQILTFFHYRKWLPLTPFFFFKQASINTKRRRRQTGWTFCPPKFFSCLHFRSLIRESWEGRRGQGRFFNHHIESFHSTKGVKTETKSIDSIPLYLKSENTKQW